jgi:hypothetical protein
MAEYSAQMAGPVGSDVKYGNSTLGMAARMAEDPQVKALLIQMARRVASTEPEMARFREWADRADGLYYAEHITDGGPDLWWNHPSATTPGRAHVSVNIPGPIVDIPAALQAVEPIENMLPTDTTPEARRAAAALERVYTVWKWDERFDLKYHKAATVKALYGRTAARIYWEDGDESGEKGHPCVEVISQPRNLYLGWKSDDYEKLEWAAYVTRMDPNSVIETYGVDVTPIKDELTNAVIPFVTPREDPWATDYIPSRPWIDNTNSMIEVWDYWYRLPVWKNGKYKGMETYNIVTCGNYVLRGPVKYAEYGGDLPYIPVFNTYIPGLPNGRPELYDAEQLIREKFEKITAGSQMISNAVAGDYWQLVGENAPMRVPPGLKPKRNELVGPGPGNRIEVITPFVAQFQLEQFLGRLDRELSIVTGLNDLLLGLAPAQVLSSSKAINALIANYETRLSMRRALFYEWRRNIWELVIKVWAKKDKDVKQVLDSGGGRLDIIDPSLSPRDDMETAQRAISLVQSKLWSQARGMDVVGVDDPESEQDLIREESTDAALWPERVQVMAQLLSALQSLGIQTPPAAQAQAQAQGSNAAETLANALRGQAPEMTPGNGGPEPGNMAGAPGVPGQAAGNGAPFAQPPAGGPPAGQNQTLLQTMIKGGQASNRIMTQQKIASRR